MSTPYATSRVFDAARKVKAKLVAEAWPTHPATGDAPQIALTEPDWDQAAEVVWVVPQVGDDASIVWRTAPNGRDEVFEILIAVSTFAETGDAATDEADVLNRLEALADVVQRTFYDDNNALTAPTDRVRTLGIDAQVRLEGIGQVAFAIWAAPHEGLRGRTDIRYRLAFRI